MRSDIASGKNATQVAPKVGTKLCAALRKALKELRESGVPLSAFLGARGSEGRLRELLRNSGGHEFAHLFVTTARANPGATEGELLGGFISAIWDKVADGIRLKIMDDSPDADRDRLQRITDEVAEEIKPEVERLAHRLADDPDWKPRKSPKRGGRAEPTEEMMSESLLG